MDINDLAATLPDPEKDELPPYVGIKPEDAAKAAADKAFVNSLMDPKPDTEDRVKRALKSVFGIRLTKDGDYQTTFGGRQVWIKHTADYRGSTSVAKGINWATFCEVKGMSPGRNFDFARLDKTDSKPVQFDRLNVAHTAGDFVLLALGWWIALPGAKPVKIKQKSRRITRWKKDDVYLEIDLLRWDQFVELYNTVGRRSFRPIDRNLFPPCTIFKGSNNRWTPIIGHWFYNYVKTESHWLVGMSSSAS